MQGVLNIESSVAFWKTESRLRQTAVSPASHTCDEKQLLGLIWLFQARVITTRVCVYHSECFYDKMKARSCVFLDKFPSHFSLDDYN